MVAGGKHTGVAADPRRATRAIAKSKKRERNLPAGVLQPYRRRFRWEVHHRDRGPEVLKERVLVLLLICYVKSVLGRLVLQARDPVDEGQSRVLLSSGRLDLPTSPATGRSIRRP